MSNTSRNSQRDENRVRTFLRSQGMPVYTNAEYRKHGLVGDLPERFAVRQFKYDGWYNENYSRADFMVFEGDGTTAIEVKSQRVAGTADEKLPQVAINAFMSDHADRTIILMLGLGFRNRSKACLSEIIEHYSEMCPDKSVQAVDTFAEFTACFTAQMNIAA